MSLRPAQTGFKSQPTSVHELSQKEVLMLKNSQHRLTIQHQSQSEPLNRVMFTNLPLDLNKAFSGYFDARLPSTGPVGALGRISRSHTVTISGGNYDSIKAVFDYMLSFVEKKKTDPKIKDPKLVTYMQMHEASTLLSVDALAADMHTTILQILETPITATDLEMQLKPYPVTSEYVQMVLPNLTFAIVNWHGGWHADHEFLPEIKRKCPKFWALLRESVDAMTAEHEAKITAEAARVEAARQAVLMRREAREGAASFAAREKAEKQDVVRREAARKKASSFAGIVAHGSVNANIDVDVDVDVNPHSNTTWSSQRSFATVLKEAKPTSGKGGKRNPSTL